MTPTIGRVVYYYPSFRDLVDTPPMASRDVGQPMRADVVFVHDSGTVNLLVTDHTGLTHTRCGVAFTSKEVTTEAGQRYTAVAGWMPYQKGQAAKTEDIEEVLDMHLTAQMHSDHAPLCQCAACRGLLHRAQGRAQDQKGHSNAG